MIEELKDMTIVRQAGGRFKLSSMIQKRMLELMEGSRPLIRETEGRTMMEIAVQEIKEGKIMIDEAPEKPEKKMDLL